MHRNFSRIADVVTDWTGRPWAAMLAVLFVAVWGLGLLHFGVQDQNYEFVINTGTTIVTFIMVFLIQHSTNRGSRAVQLKLDALIAAQDRAENKLVGAEELLEVEIKELQIEHRERVRRTEEEVADEGDETNCVLAWQEDNKRGGSDGM